MSTLPLNPDTPQLPKTQTKKPRHAADPDPIQRLWPKNDQPMIRLFARGPAALTDSELVSVLLRRGNRDRSAVDVARDLLAKTGCVSALFTADAANLNGLPPDGLARLYAAAELVRRALLEKLSSSATLSAPGAVRDYLRLTLHGRPHEVFVVVYLDAQHRVVASEDLFRGTLTQTSVYPREVVKRALHFNAAAVIFAHNHPSGVAEPSRADEALTIALKQALALVDVRVLDHFVVAGDGALSFAERGLL